MVDRVTELEVRSEKGQGGFVINRTSASPSSYLPKDHPGSLQVEGAFWRARIPGQTPQNLQDRGIIPDDFLLWACRKP
jgi:hypothetical protein